MNALSGLHICCFTNGLDEMKRKDQRVPVKVLRVLKERPRFSTFEATANVSIARTMTYLLARGYIEIDNSPGYPWSIATLTARGLKMIEDDERETPASG